ncbi:tRNA (adenosine(37)-N6)-threonylcarbamoyltransferase complex ATPase subunit type 1 TsaE [Patescibacteria group bacterium]|nr:tRNA (adenosine(37)-N6)-threonylcarbamoyltransferase complex ATPase subunit type 1 TsaE [Patescibacteria group bacterium]
MTPTVRITRSAAETADFGSEIGQKLAGEKGRAGVARVYCLYGALGSGKTTFVRGFARGLGISCRLPSPTFIIVRRYRLLNNFGSFLYHLDLYRLPSAEALDSLGITEIFSDPQHIVIVEWAEKLGCVLPGERTDVRFSVFDNGTHQIITEKKR